MAKAGPGREQDGGRERRRDQGRRQMRLDQNESDHRTEHDQEREQPFPEGWQPVLFPLRQRRDPDDDRDLGELARLERERAEGDPPTCPVTDGGDLRRPGEDHQDQQDRHRPQHRPGQPAIDAVVHERRDEQDDAARRRAGQLAHDEVAVREAGLLCRERAGRIHRKQPHQNQASGHREKRPANPGGRSGGGLYRGESPVERRLRHPDPPPSIALTSSSNVSPLTA